MAGRLRSFTSGLRTSVPSSYSSAADMMVLSFIPSRRENEYLPIGEAAAVQEIVSRLPRGQRLLIHGRVNPNQPGDMDDIDALAGRWKVSALKCYTQWGPDGSPTTSAFG